MTRTEKREEIIKILYQKLLLNKYDDEITKELINTDDFIKEIIENIELKKDILIKTISKYLKTSWSFDRLNLIDQAILLLSTYELKYTKTPSIAVIDEAINLSKKYSDDEMPKMINAILDSIYHNEELENE